MNNKLLNVLIIGCGNIAGGYDLQKSKGSSPLGHAKAYQNHGNFKVLACIDPDKTKRESFQKRWEIPLAFSSLKEISFEPRTFDVISICSPTQFHALDIISCIELKPKLIFCEKPLTTSNIDSENVILRCLESNIHLAVNFSRRWSPIVQQIKYDIDSNKWGLVRSVSGIYNKGILNNGSHMIDLLIYFFGPLILKSTGNVEFDFFPDDPTVDVTLQTEKKIPIHINTANSSDYSIFELQIVTEFGVISMEDGGNHWRIRKASKSKLLPSYRFLDKGKWIISKEDYSLSLAIDNIYNTLLTNAPLLSCGTTALQSQAICEQIKNLSKTPHQQ
jgi:predicted dehydrogenase